MAREPRPSHAFKILLFIVLPFVAAVLIAFFLIYVPDRKTSIIERNYRVLETAKRQFQGLFRGRMIAFKRFRREECQPKNAIPLKQVRAVIEQGKEMLSLALKGERELYLQDKDNCAMAIPEIWAPLQKLRVFDNVVLVDSKEEHRILYQWESPHTIPVVDFKSLLASAQHTSQPQQSGSAESTQSEARKPLDMQQLTQTAARQPLDVQQFGITYHLFLIPVSLHQTLPQDFTLAGLVRQQHFTNEAYKLSPTLLAVIGFILLMVVLVWPFLTLWYIDPSERLRGLDVRVLLVSSMFAVSLLTFFLLYCFTDLVYQKVFDNDMKTLGKQLKENFEKELEDMFRPLTVLKNSIQRVCDTNLCTKITLQDTAKIKEWDKTLRDKWDKILRDELEQKLWKSSDLLRISSLLWISGEGKSVNRWEPKPLEDSQPPTWKLEPNPQVQKRRTQSGWPTSQDRRYFTDAQAGLLWKLKFKSPSDKTQDIRITLEVVQSQFSGDITVVMAAPVDIKAHDSPHVVAVGSRFPSLTEAILPSGLGFAVIDDTGEILLHSEATNDLLPENLLQERDKTGPLRSAMFAHQAQHINPHYYGTGYRFYITPLANTPWFLIVFHDRGFLHKANLTLLLGWFLLFSPYTGAWGITFVLLQLFHNRWEWLWPDHRRIKTYREATWMVIGTSIACFAIVVWKAHALSTVVMGWIVLPPLLLALLYLKLGRGQADDSQYQKYAKYAKRVMCGTIVCAVVLAVDGFYAIFHDRDWLSLCGVWLVVIVSVILVWRAYSQPHTTATQTTDTASGSAGAGNMALRRAYGSMLFSLLFIVVIVPTGLVFLDVYQQTVEALVKQYQLDYAKKHNGHAEKLHQKRVRKQWPEWMVKKQWDEPKDWYHFTLANDSHEAPKPFSGETTGVKSFIWTSILCKWRSDPESCKKELTPLSRHASAVVLQLLLAYNWVGERFGFMTYNEANDLTWRWELRDGNYDFFWDHPDSSLSRLYVQKIVGNPGPPLADKPLPLMTGKTQLDILPSNALSVVIGLLIVLASLWVIHRLLLLAAQRIFLMDYSEDDIPNDVPGIHPPLWTFVKSAGHTLQELLQTSNAEVVDLLQSAAPSALQGLPDSTWQTTVPLIIVDHLESRLHEEAWRVAVLSMLEALAFRYTGPVLIRSEINPLYSLVEWVSEGGAKNAHPKGTTESETPPQGTGGIKERAVTEELERWARVFAGFSGHRLALLKWPDTLDNFAKQPEDEVLEARFWTLWSQCTRSEKLALRQLAEEGFLNPGKSEVIRSEVIRSLGHRLLIYRSPALLMRESFRRFVLRAESSQTIAQWEGETEASWLSRLQMPLLAGLIAITAFLLSTQQELYTTVVALASTFTAVLPRIIQLFGISQGRRGENQVGN